MAATAPRADGPPRLQRLLDEAQRLRVDVAGRSEEELRAAVREAWIEENQAAIESWNAWVDEHGLPLERYRMF